MSWLKSLVRPKIATQQRREMPKDLWQKCPNCDEMLYSKDLLANWFVCHGCGHHLRLTVEQRLGGMLDKDSWTEIEQPKQKADHLKFKDRKKYSERLRVARKSTGRRDAVVIGDGTIEGEALTVIFMDFSFMAGSMGTAVGDAIIQAADHACKTRKPLLMITASGGARMQEGILSLMQMARATAALKTLKEHKLPYIVLLTDPTTGGVSASFAMQGDFTYAEPGALIGFAGPRVIQQTIGATLPDGFQKAEYLYEHGMLDGILPRGQQRGHFKKLLSTLATPSPFRK